MEDAVARLIEGWRVDRVFKRSAAVRPVTLQHKFPQTPFVRRDVQARARSTLRSVGECAVHGYRGGPGIDLLVFRVKFTQSPCERSEASRVGNECVSMCISRWSPYN